jgi:hypothetical protein
MSRAGLRGTTCCSSSETAKALCTCLSDSTVVPDKYVWREKHVLKARASQPLMAHMAACLQVAIEYQNLQGLAKAQGICANQSKDNLVAQLMR